MALDPACTEAACAALDAHFRRTGDRAGLAWLDEVLRGLEQKRLRAFQQRNAVSARDTLQPHALDLEALAALRTALAGTGKVKRAWLACKQVEDPDAAQVPHFLLLLEMRWTTFSSDKVLSTVAAEANLPGTFHVLTADHDRGLAKRIRKVAAEPVYTHGRDA
jgi:hypothetical protein